MPIERRRKLNAAGMAKRSFRRVSEGQDARSERPSRWQGLAPTRRGRPTGIHEHATEGEALRRCP